MCSQETKVTDFHDTIAQLCINQFNALGKTGKPKETEWTTLSCIVLEDQSQFEVVALGTGTKCIGHDRMSKDGDILNDSHAEVVCRRAFLRYIYESMLHHEDSKFIFNSEEKKFKLKQGVKLHFFSTHVPCGDASIFPKQDSEDFGNPLVHSNSSKRKKCTVPNIENKRIKLETESDIFRTGAKCLPSDANQDLRLEGASFHVIGVVRTKPGRGTPTLSVSCSDKIAKWCHLGVQGALLAILLSNPLYFSSFTICGDTPFNEEAMKRALFQRLGDVDLEPPYCRNEIVLGQANTIFAYGKTTEKNACPASIAWLRAKSVERQTEVSVDGRRQGVTKKQMKSSGALKICKLELFKKFIEVLKQFNITFNSMNIEALTYKEVKMCSKQYQTCWLNLKKRFKTWTVKDDVFESFSL